VTDTGGKLTLMIDLSDIEETLWKKSYRAICGVDEAGRGPLAGPVVAAAVIIPPGVEIDGVNDSKKLSAQRRESVFEDIVAMELPCAVGIIDNDCIDQINILKASLMAMRKAVASLAHSPDFVLVDGNRYIPNTDIPQFAIVHGDSRCRSIAAASIVAKVTRDRIMDKYETVYPSFSFSRHRGYATPTHLKELRRHGPCEIHRKSFKPVADLINQYALI
jgi:ribonuclease HII